MKWGSLLKSSPSSRSLKGRMKELEKVSTRIEAKTVKLEKLITTISKNL
jgi:hypothetical protein